MPEFLNNSFGFKLTIRQAVEEVVRFMKEDEKRRYKITIGTDSEGLADRRADFVSALVVHRVGNGGRYFWRRILDGDKFHTLRDRIIKEVLISLDLAKEVIMELQKLSSSGNFPEWDFEIHVDVGENGETKSMIQEVVGIVRAHNFQAKTKPESYAASNVADRHV